MTDSQQSIAKKGERYTAQQMIDALHETRGMVSLAAKRLGCAPDTVYRYIREYPTVAHAQRLEREAVTDLAELSLYKAIQSGEGWAVCFYLKTQGKERGYVETTRNLNLNLTPQDITKLGDAELDDLYAKLIDASRR